MWHRLAAAAATCARGSDGNANRRMACSCAVPAQAGLLSWLGCGEARRDAGCCITLTGLSAWLAATRPMRLSVTTRAYFCVVRTERASTAQREQGRRSGQAHGGARWRWAQGPLRLTMSRAALVRSA